jgi:hypothetical protein
MQYRVYIYPRALEISTDFFFNFSSTKLIIIQGILYALNQTVCLLLSKFAAPALEYGTFEYSQDEQIFKEL